MDSLDIEEEHILYFVKDEGDGVRRRDIEQRFPRFDSINYKLGKMRNIGLVKRNKKRQRNAGNKKPTYVWFPRGRQIEKYEDENGSLSIPEYAWHEYVEEYFDTFEERLRAIESKLYD